MIIPALSVALGLGIFAAGMIFGGFAIIIALRTVGFLFGIALIPFVALTKIPAAIRPGFTGWPARLASLVESSPILGSLVLGRDS